MTRSPRHRSLSAGVAMLVLAATMGGARPAAATSPASPSPAAVAKAPAVTLITGDRVRLFDQPGGAPAVAIEPAPGRENVGFLRDTRAGVQGTETSVVPADAAPLLAAGLLDPKLFDVTELARQGFTDAASPALPLIVTYGQGLAATAAPASAAAAAPAGAAQAVRALPSINGSAVLEDRQNGSAFWSWLTGTPAGRPTAPRHLAAGVAKVWLDGISHPLLDRSAAQIGAPTAWQAGFTGAGVTVGVLDTGVKADHPDLAGKVVEARDFTGTRPDAGDDAGHGTHVAGIIAGTGAASNLKYRGVAPDAKLISGKVCVIGRCPDSAVIAGMEWIAPRVPVVNMSLGGGSTDGTDPMSQAVNRLTAQYGTLFVIAAGDVGDPVGSIASPAAADAALAVGSVTRQDETSPFSSRGPRLGDRAVKPDIAAPGSGIVSARAAGTPAGDLEPVDANYAVLSGTSIATPHVAGAAAILAQQHPAWTAAQLKPTLMSTARPTSGVFDQGAGRVDVARAVTQPVSATGGSLSYGFFAWPHNQHIGKTVTYRNDGDGAVTLALGVAAAGPGGQPAPPGLFTPSTGQVTVPAHGTAGVSVTANPASGGAGLYGGRLTATGAGVTVQTALDAFLEPESYDLTVRLIGRTGQFNAGLGQAVNTATGQAFGVRPFTAGGTAVVRLPRGRYDVNAMDVSADPANQGQSTVVTLMSRPDVTLTADTMVTLDATAGRPVGAIVDRPDARLQFGELGLQSTNPAGNRGSSLSWFARPGHQLFAVPTGEKVTDHPYAFFFRAVLAPVRPDREPAFVYQLAFLERGRIPANAAYRVRNRDLATVDARYHTQGAPSQGLRADFPRLAIPSIGVGVFELYAHTLPSRRTEYYTASADVTWMHVLGVFPADQSDAEVIWSFRSYRPGRYQSGWNRAPLGPAFGDPGAGWGVTRAGSQLQVALTLLSGSDPEQYTAPPLGMAGTTTLSRDGVSLGTSAGPGAGAFPIPDSPGTYTLRAVATRSVPWSVIGTSADVTWTFREPGAAAPVAPLPLLVVRARGEVDEHDVAPAGSPYRLSLEVQHQPGAPEGRLAGLAVEASYDDGATWTPAPTEREGDGGFAVLHHPAGDGFVSLRITARDAGGSSVTQTVIRAYQIAART
jgi:subtilisin family serine protease